MGFIGFSLLSFLLRLRSGVPRGTGITPWRSHSFAFGLALRWLLVPRAKGLDLRKQLLGHSSIKSLEFPVFIHRCIPVVH